MLSRLEMKKLVLENKLLANKIMLLESDDKFTVTYDQYDALDGLRSNLMNVALDRNTEDFNGEYWGEYLDELGISWTIQNWVSDYAQNTSNVHSSKFRQKFNIVD